MKRYGETYTLTQDVMDEIATYMDDQIRESLVDEMIDDPEAFLLAYIDQDEEILDILENEFGIEVER